MLYGIKLANRVNKKTDVHIVILYDSYEKAVKYEREIRFLDNVVDRDVYKEKVEKIKKTYLKSLLLTEITDTVEYINEYPILVEHF